MNRQLAKLYDLAGRPERVILGLMSGTSLDGLDMAVCRVQGCGRDTRLEVTRFRTAAYPPEYQEYVLRVFAKDGIRQSDLCGLNAWIAALHASLVLEALSDWGLRPEEIDLIASHGQTVFHAPLSLVQSEEYPNSTLQIGDGDHIALRTGIITVSDFRQKHVAAGGEGAPLALYGDYLLFSDQEEDRILLNMGGIANFTYLPSAASQDQGRRAFATDVGPANTLMNQFVKQRFGLEMDRDARLARQGTVSGQLLAALLDHPFFRQELPRTTGPELFNLDYLGQAISRSGQAGLSDPDLLATLCAFSAVSIANAIADLLRQLPDPGRACVYASGGGLSNPLLMEGIRQGLASTFAGTGLQSFDRLGLDPDAKEAALFALLANETVAGNPENVQEVASAPAICMGKISFPR